MNTVLVVEDDAHQRHTLSNLLSPHYTTVCCATGLEALQALMNLEPDLVLADITLPDISGIDLLRCIRENMFYGQTPVVGLSTVAMPDFLHLFLMVGFNDCLQKPIWDEAHLLEKISPLLETSDLSHLPDAGCRT